jgi:hypothetical protein
MSDERIPRIRRAPIPDDALIVVRGEQPAEIARRLAAQFRLRFPDWGRWGLSAFYARSEREVDDLAYDQVVSYATLHVYSIAGLIEAGSTSSRPSEHRT